MVNIQGLPFRPTAEGTTGLPSREDIYKQMYMPRNMAEDLLAKQLKNKIDKVTSKYAEPTAQSDIAYKNAMAQKALQPEKIGGQMANLYRLRETFPEGSKERNQIEQYISTLAQGTQGTSISFDPDTGQPMIQIGGSGRSGNRGGSGTYINQQGDITTQPTSATATNLQQKILGSETVEPIIKEVINTMPQFQSGWTNALSGTEGLANKWLGADFKLPSAKATGEAAIKKASEALVKQFGLNANASNRHAVETIVTPAPGESISGYKERLMKGLQDFVTAKQKNQEILRRGINIGKGVVPGQNNQAPMNNETTAHVTPESMEQERAKDEATARQFNTDPMKVLQARSEGVKTASQFRQWLKEHP